MGNSWENPIGKMRNHRNREEVWHRMAISMGSTVNL
jgi:hypothetical protein